MPRIRPMSLALLGLIALGGCTSPQLYAAGQGWQQQACQKLQDSQERTRCLHSAARSFDDYQREAAAASATR